MTFIAPHRRAGSPRPRFQMLLLPMLLLAGLAAIPAMARDNQLQSPAGYVVGLSAVDAAGSEPPAVSVMRQGQDMLVQIGASLFDGDRIVVRQAAASVTIETAKDHRLRVDASTSPHLVSGALPTGGRFAELAAIVGELFKAPPERATVNLVGRSDAGLRLLLGAGVVQHVRARSDLWIGWRGGVGPYRVEMIGQSGKRKLDLVVLKSVETSNLSTRIELPASAVGHLTLVVRDARMTEARTLILTDSDGAFPPRDLSDGAPTAAFGQVLQALWFLQRQPHAWDLQAASIAAQASDYPPAIALLDMLADGRRPER